MRCISGKSRLKRIERLSGTGIIILAVMITGCAGVPERPADWMPADILPAECAVYLSLSVPENKDILSSAMAMVSGDDIIEKGLEETGYLFIGIQDPAERASTYIVGTGTYPLNTVRAGLAVSSGWKRRRGTYIWYQNTETGLGLSFPEAGLFCASSTDVEPMLSRLASGQRNLPAQVKRSMLADDIFLYIPELDSSLVTMFIPGITSFPAERLLLRLHRSESGYVMGMTAVTGDEKSASVLKSALKLVLLSRAKKTSGFSMAAFLKEIRVEVEGTEVHVSGVSFEDAELLTLVETLNRKDKEGDS